MADELARAWPTDIWEIAGQRRDAPYLGRLSGVSYRPVFVLGEHRSGTTILYDLLASTGSFNYLTAYHSLYYDQVLANHVRGTTAGVRDDLNTRLCRLGVSTRLVDAIAFDAAYPEEYCFFLQARSRSFRLRRRNLHTFDQLCRKLQYTGDPGRPLLLKNPFDFDNFLTISRLVPGARFVFIHRHPLSTLSSMLQMVRRNWSEGNVINELYSRAYARLHRSRAVAGLARWLLRPDSGLALPRRAMVRRIARRARYYEEHIAELSAGDYVSLRYEDLCRNPRGEMERIFRFLGQTPCRAVDYAARIRPRGLALLPDIERVEATLRRRFVTTMAYHGYGRNRADFAPPG
jgi:Sulfotransferase family